MAGRLEESYAGLEQKVEQRTAELSETLAQQTATSQVLEVISSSPGELAPVFDVMLEKAVRICDAKFGQMFLMDADKVRMIASLGVPSALAEFEKDRGAFTPTGNTPLQILTQSKQAEQTPDMAVQTPDHPAVRLGGARTLIAVPMLKEDEQVGAIVIY